MMNKKQEYIVYKTATGSQMISFSDQIFNEEAIIWQNALMWRDIIWHKNYKHIRFVKK